MAEWKKEDVVIVGFTPRNEGVVIHLNKSAKLKTGNVLNTEFWVSWDKIGDAIIDSYCTALDKCQNLREEAKKKEVQNV